MKKYPNIEDLKSSKLENSLLEDVKVEVTEHLEGESVQMRDGQIFRSDGTMYGDDLTLAPKKPTHLIVITDGDPNDVTGTPEEIAQYKQEQNKILKDVLKTQPTFLSLDEVVNSIGKIRPSSHKSSDVKPE